MPKSRNSFDGHNYRMGSSSMSKGEKCNDNIDVEVISVANDFSEFPGGRYRSDGDASGEAFREDFLIKSIKKFNKVQIILNGTAGYGSSFLEESFGGLVRKHGYRYEDLKNILIFDEKNGPYERYVKIIWQYISDAKPEPQ